MARTLLRALEDAARERGYAFVRLDTGPLQRGAMTLYASEGYTEIGNFNANPIAAYWGEKALTRWPLGRAATPQAGLAGAAAHSHSLPSCSAA